MFKQTNKKKEMKNHCNRETVFFSYFLTASKTAEGEPQKQRLRRTAHECLSLLSALPPCKHFIVKMK